MAFVVGVGITLLSVIMPARRASRIPPVAAMRPELGFEALSAKRLVAGTVVTVVGVVAFVVGLFVRPGGTVGTLVLAGGGALLMFLGVASVSSTVARPVTKLIGWPIAKVFKTPGHPGRRERRTGAATHLGHRRRADDRRRAGQRRRRVRLVAARHVLRRPRELAQGRLHHHRRLVPGAAPDRRHRAGPGARALGGHGRARGTRPRSTGTTRRSAPSIRWRSSSSSTSGCRTAATRPWPTAGSWSSRTPPRTSTSPSATRCS